MDSDRPGVGNQPLILAPGDPAAPGRHAARQRALTHAATYMLAALGTPTLPRMLLAHACEVLGARQGWLYAVNQAGETVLAVATDSSADTQATSALDRTRLAAHLFQRTLPLIVNCADDHEARDRFCAGGDCPLVIGVPLQWDGRQIGVIQLARATGERALDADDLGLLSQFAELAAAALARHLELTAARSSDSTASRLTRALREQLSHSANLSASLSATLAAIEHERRRIALELHDGLRPNLLGAQLQLEAAHAELYGGSIAAARAQVAQVQQILAAADSEVSRVVRALRPPLLAESGLAVALLDLGLRWGALTGIELTFDLDDQLPELSEATAMALYRIAQEALSNVARHAAARTVSLGLRRVADELVLRISDDGCGSAAPRGGGVGLFSIAERAHSIGALLQIESPPGAGTRIQVTLPLVL